MPNSDKPLRETPIALTECGAALALDVVPDRWTWLILRQLMFGVGRFADIQNEIGIPKSVLSARLKSMVENGLAEKQPYRDGTARTRLAYVLTRKGRGLVPVLLALMQWGDVHLKGGESTLEPTDRRYGHALKIGIAPPDKTLPIRRLKILPDNAAEG